MWFRLCSTFHRLTFATSSLPRLRPFNGLARRCVSGPRKIKNDLPLLPGWNLPELTPDDPVHCPDVGKDEVSFECLEVGPRLRLAELQLQQESPDVSFGRSLHLILLCRSSIAALQYWGMRTGSVNLHVDLDTLQPDRIPELSLSNSRNLYPLYVKFAKLR